MRKSSAINQCDRCGADSQSLSLGRDGAWLCPDCYFSKAKAGELPYPPQIIMGQGTSFGYDLSDLPRIAAALERIADALEAGKDGNSDKWDIGYGPVLYAEQYLHMGWQIVGFANDNGSAIELRRPHQQEDQS